MDSGSFTDQEGKIRQPPMPVHVPFMGHKEMALPGATLPCQPPPHCLFLPTFYCPLLSLSLPTPHPSADPKTVAFSKLSLAFPDLLPQAGKVSLLAELGRAGLGPRPGMPKGETMPASRAPSCPAL